MGLDVSTYVVFGIALDKSFVKPVEKIRGCNHKVNEKAQFCSECGKPVWIETNVSLLDSMECNQLSYFYADYKSNEIIIGFALNVSGSHRSYKVDFLEVTEPTKEMLTEIKNFCDIHKISYEPSDFKTYAFSHFSY